MAPKFGLEMKKAVGSSEWAGLAASRPNKLFAKISGVAGLPRKRAA